MNRFSQPLVKKSTRHSIKRLTALVGMLALLTAMVPVRPAQAAALTSLKDIMSTITESVASNHTISFVSPSAVANNTTITITFPTGFSLASTTEDEVDIAGSTEGELTTAADCSASDDASVGISGQTITITLCTGDGGDFTNSETITIEVGTNATSSGTGQAANRIVNQSAAQNTTDAVIDVATGTGTDTGSFAVEIIADDSVAVSASVDPAITFSISDVTIGFGTLDIGQECWALGTAPASCDSTQTAAHTMAVSTNATDGWAITYNGATLTNLSSDTISVADINGDADGAPGTEQFAIGAATNGDSTVATDYDQASDNFRFIASTTTTLASETAPTATETLSMYYLANIGPTTETGTYSTSITYIATGTF